MRPIQAWARSNRIRFFLPSIPSNARILEIGPGEGWFRRAVVGALPVDYLTIDTDAPADINGDIRNWEEYGIRPGSFDVVVAFEVLEHVDCFAECHELLKPDGLLLITTPMPHMDWLLKLLEALGLTQKRTSAHSNLVYLKNIPGFVAKEMRQPFGIGQWAVFQRIPK